MTKLILRNHNETYLKVDCDQGVGWELREAFSFRPPNFQFHPKFKAKLWDGFLRMYNPNTRIILRGLTPQVIKWIEDRGYEYEYDGDLQEPYSVEEANEFVEKLNPKHPPRDYQLDAFVHAMRMKRSIIISPTGSGKSLLQYMICMNLLKQGKRGLLIVPRSALVEQMYSDFEDYSVKNKKDMSKYCHRVYSGHDKVSDKPIIISTWQSLQRMPARYFEQFDYVICDEVHQAQAKSLTDIVSKCTKAQYRIGVTGTLSGAKAHEYTLIGLFGQVYRATTTAELMAKKQLAELTIKCMILKYSDEECKYMSKCKYQDEIEYIIGHKARNKFITNLALSLTGNTIIFFNFVEKHGQVIFDLLNSKVKDGRKVFFIHGGTGVDEREQIRRIIESERDAIIVGSVGVLSTGTNIVAIDNVIFASPTKSKIRNLQSIGRGLRVNDSKQSATLFDIADDFSWRKKENYTLKHFIERLKTYSEETFKFKIYKIDMKGQ